MLDLNKSIQEKQAQIDKLNRDTEELKKDLNKETPIWTKIPELNIEISQQMYNGKTYAEILELVDENQIADHNILFELRKLTDKYPQFIDFWVFTPNPDLISKNNNSVARFIADSDGANFGCNRIPSDSDASLGVFLWRKLK